MKGIVFTEFVELVEKSFSPSLMDDLFDSVPLQSGGAYTSVGTYDHREMVALVGELSGRTGLAVPLLLRTFGKHLMQQFVARFPAFFEVVDAFQFLEHVDGYIHVEVRKLYPDAELPRFIVDRVGENQLSMIYKSDRPFADLAQGLIEGAIDHFGESITIERQAIGSSVRFLLTQLREAPVCL